MVCKQGNRVSSSYNYFFYFFQIEKMLDQITSFITGYELANLRDYWSYLDHRLFARLEQVVYFI